MLRELLARRSAKWPVRPCQTQMASCPALSPFLFAPIFFGFPLHGRCIRVLHFEPIGGVAGTAQGKFTRAGQAGDVLPKASLCRKGGKHGTDCVLAASWGVLLFVGVF